MSLGPTLETARLVLRPPTHADFDGFAAMGAEADTMRFLGGATTRDQSWRVMAMVAGSWALLGYGMFSVFERGSGRWIGRVGPWRPGGTEGSWPGNEVGWGLVRAATGRGFAAEAATAAMDWAFDTLGWEHVIHCIAEDNAPSIALALRLGSQLEHKNVPLPLATGVVPGDIYGQSRETWRARRL